MKNNPVTHVIYFLAYLYVSYGWPTNQQIERIGSIFVPETRKCPRGDIFKFKFFHNGFY